MFRKALSAVSLTVLLAPLAAQAVLIDFDDLAGPVVLTDQYAALGVNFSA